MSRAFFCILLLCACGAPPAHVVTVKLEGDGLGLVTAAGLSCPGSTCTGTYAQGTTVELVPQPDPSSFFAGWSGACAGSSSCRLTVQATQSASATFMLKEHAVTVAMRLDGGGTAAVTSSPPGLVCGVDTCYGRFATGSSVTLTAAPHSARFVRWTGNCGGNAPNCKLLVTGADDTVGAVFLGANYVFATSTHFDPSALTLAQADLECNARAAAAGLPGAYVAWLSTTTVNARSRLGSARGWVRIDGLPFADSVDALTSGRIFYPVQFDETGAGLARVDVLSGTNPDGTIASSMNCADWTGASGGLLLGRVTAGTRGWTAFEGTACTPLLDLHVYCFGTDVATVLPLPQSQGRKAFVSKAAWTGSGGLASLDHLCAVEATAAGRSGTFKALAATSTASAASRFNLSGLPWVRTDGVAITASASDLALNRVVAPLDVAADGTYQSSYNAWTGASSPNVAGTADSTCADWTTGASSATGNTGSPDATAPTNYEFPVWSFFGGAVLSCDQQRQAYCFQE